MSNYPLLNMSSLITHKSIQKLKTITTVPEGKFDLISKPLSTPCRHNNAPQLHTVTLQTPLQQLWPVLEEECEMQCHAAYFEVRRHRHIRMLASSTHPFS
ncbi:hypothetical protein TNCT_107231 [Trichonephila clavata]|uniref:Uncharacterized protein n=1 Tax=Trichonephila clavata TaxID=2740835 RepID=A0A8X6GGZ9_TRICU|nr:hypothetical protein TNCT_374141 [Trichonephila clavata]GFR04591.1 hypothetical protein TNCT_107231 [Trichonephila clavata]